MNKFVRWLINILAVIAISIILVIIPYIKDLTAKIPKFCLYSNPNYSPGTIGGISCFIDTSWIAPLLISILIVFLIQKYVRIKRK